MARKPKKQRRNSAKRGGHVQAHASHANGDQATPQGAMLYAGLGLLAVAIFASGMLVWQHFTAGSLPGCGPGSACAQATGSVWGRVPLINWPISFLGLAYFIGLAAAWLAAPRCGMGVLPWIVRLGAVFSVFYVGVMVVGGMLCPYCIASHVANLAFLGVLVTARQQGQASRAPQPLFNGSMQRLAIVFIAATAVLAGWQMQFSQRIAERAERELEESTAAIIAGAAAREQAGVERPATGERAATSSGFTGRYLYGPQRAPIRIVMFTNYQCIDCQRIEAEVEHILATRDDVSLSIKHFPMGTDCNPHVSRNMHPNSCWAARAVETAGLLGGVERFWQMHRWVFSRQGLFTQPELVAGLQQLGWSDPQAFLREMTSDRTLELVQQDIEEGRDLGLLFTPMIFINGTELRGWTVPNALLRAVTALAATNPPSAGPEGDQPVGAFEKYVGDWREDTVRRLSRVDSARSIAQSASAEEARVRIVLFGDYSEQRVAEADAHLRQLIADRDDASYTFRHYPVNESCNVHATATLYDHSCWAHSASEAAAQVYGASGFWTIHDWLLANQHDPARAFNDDALRQAADSLGLNAEAIIQAMDDPRVTNALRLDANTGRNMRIRGVPMILVNEKWVPRWSLEGYDVLATIIEEAAGEETARH